MCYVQCCLFFEEKNRVFVPQDMLKHIQGTKEMIIFFEKQTRRARQIFVSVCSNCLTVAMAMAVRNFYKHSSKT